MFLNHRLSILPWQVKFFSLIKRRSAHETCGGKGYKLTKNNNNNNNKDLYKYVYSCSLEVLIVDFDIGEFLMISAWRGAESYLKVQVDWTNEWAVASLIEV